MNFKKVVSLVLAASIFAVPASIVGKVDAKTTKIKVGMVTDTGGLGDKSFNDLANKGLNTFDKKNGAKHVVLQSTKQEDYEPNLKAMVQRGEDLTFGIGFMLADSMTKVAKQNPNKKFAIVDAVVDAKNVASITFKENEAGFLAGIAAAKTTKTKKIGFIGGMEIPAVQRYEIGFKAGIKAINPKIKVISKYANSFTDSDKGKTIAITEHQQGADVIFGCAGATGLGLFKAASEKNFWAIGVDQDQSNLAKKNTLCSAVKKVDSAVLKVAQLAAAGKFKGKTYNYGLSDDGVGISDNAHNLPKAVSQLIEKYSKQIISGKTKVPTVK